MLAIQENVNDELQTNLTLDELFEWKKSFEMRCMEF